MLKTTGTYIIRLDKAQLTIKIFPNNDRGHYYASIRLAMLHYAKKHGDVNLFILD